MSRVPTTEWGRRARAAGLSQDQLAYLAGMTKNGLSRALRTPGAAGVPRGIITIIVAWEQLTAEQRAEVIHVLDDH